MSILNFFSYAKHFVQASLVGSDWARAFEFYARINQGLKSASSKFDLDRLKIVDSGALWKLSILNFFSYAKHFVQVSLVWCDCARALKFYTHINQGLKSCLVKVLSRSVENCRFWSTLKMVDLNIFTRC